MEKEIWKQIRDCEKYQISNLGEVRSKYFGGWRILKGSIQDSGYRYVTFGKNGTTVTTNISSLVLETFIGERPKEREASHLNGNKLDNRLCNLKWETWTENQLRAIIKKAKESDFTKEEKINIKKLCKQLKNL